jgi:hypothetical protein
MPDLLLMPDHLHMLIGVPGDAQLSNLIRDFKRITTRIANISWQRNFFDHRLRHDESEHARRLRSIALPELGVDVTDGLGKALRGQAISCRRDKRSR